MFEAVPVDVADLRDLVDAGLVDVISGCARASAAVDARKYAAIGEFVARGRTDQHPDWACDDWDAAAAEIAAALNIGHGRASVEMDVALMLRNRLPKVAALFMAGLVTSRQVQLVEDRTRLLTDPEAVAELDEVLAERLTSWGSLSYYKLEQVLDARIDAIDPGAVRRTRDRARSRDFTVADPDPDGTVALYGRVFATDGALFKQRLEVMVRSVCEDDTRTMMQRRADAIGAIGAGSLHLACRCENPDCAAKVDDGRASSIVIHIITEDATTKTSLDPLLHGERIDDDDITQQPEQPAPAYPTRPKPALIIGGGLLPAVLLAELLARGAKLSPIAIPAADPEPRYRPSRALDEFVRMRDLSCRYPGCDRPAISADVDHTIAYPRGPTHPGNTKCYCRKHQRLGELPS